MEGDIVIQTNLDSLNQNILKFLGLNYDPCTKNVSGHGSRCPDGLLRNPVSHLFDG